jgi:Cdc6-like AAA superfamily ATPase
MADVLAIIGVIGVAGQILQLTVKLGLDWKDAPEDAKSFLKEVQALKSILSETHSNVIVDDDFKAAFEGRRSALLAEFGDPTQSTNTSSLINTCKSQLEEILSDLRKRTQGHRLGWERLKGAFTAKKTRETIEDLQRRCLSLNNLISLDALSLGVQTHKEVKRARRDQDDWRREQRSKQILNWLSEADYDAQQSDFLRRRQPGTGQWLLDSQRYQKWVTTPKTTLFCPGIPGAGKTMLTSIVVDDLQNRFDNDSSVSMAYLYCEFRRQTEQTVENLLSSILRQLAQDQPSLPECVRSLHAVLKNRMRPSLRQLSNSLQTLVKSLRRVFIVVDALDECQLSDGCRTRFLNEIFNLQSGSQINIFATSRLVMGITDRFSGAISIRIRAQNSDIRQYLTGSISQLPACVAKSPQLQEEIIKSIIEAVDGM